MNSIKPKKTPQKPKKTDTSIAEWKSRLTGLSGALILFEILSGLSLYILPFSRFNQISLLLHTVIGLFMLLPILWYSWNHWLKRKGGNFSHFQLLGYLSVALLFISLLTGFVVTVQGLYSERLDFIWDIVHLLSSLLFSLFVILHLTTLIFRNYGRLGAAKELIKARRVFYSYTFFGFASFLAICFVLVLLLKPADFEQGFPDSYNWRFGQDRPFAPSFAKLDDSELQNKTMLEISKLLSLDDSKIFKNKFSKTQSPEIGLVQHIENSLEGLTVSDKKKLSEIVANTTQTIQTSGALSATVLARSASCGSSNCHSQIYQEWLPSAHRYSSMDDMFQQVQTLMVKETSSEHTRYCAGCHDPISLFSGAKNSDNITLSVEGSDEGASCVVCHSITQADIQGNGNYVLSAPQRYLLELSDEPIGKFISDFLIRTYPQHHLQSFSRALYKTPEFCAACHKQYLDTEVNTDIGKVQGQNQYDNWKSSRWSKETLKDSTTCRECHMPLQDSHDPARGDVLDYNRHANDNKHRSHRTLGTNQYIPKLHQLKGQKLHTELTEKWMRGQIEIPEIAHKWRAGPAVIIKIQAPKKANAGEEVSVNIHILNNKAGHDFPTGPMDMIQSWLEVTVTDDNNKTIYHAGFIDDEGKVKGLPVLYRADGFDRKGELIDRHNLWDLVGASYKRTLFPGMSDTVKINFTVPENTNSGSKLNLNVKLNYRKANPDFLDRVYGQEKNIRTPITNISDTTQTIEIIQ